MRRCDACGKGFYTQENLERHLPECSAHIAQLSHSVCTTCGRDVGSDLLTHYKSPEHYQRKRVHREETPVCDVGPPPFVEEQLAEEHIVEKIQNTSAAPSAVQSEAEPRRKSIACMELF